MTYGYIYKITNKVNCKIYIGQTTSTVARRWASHKCLGRGRATAVLSKAIWKHGAENFQVDTIMVCNDREHLDKSEALCIKMFKACVTKGGYNVAGGGNGHKHSEYTKKKMSETRQRTGVCKGVNLGRKPTAETKRLMSASQKAVGNKPPKGGKPCMVDGVYYSDARAAAKFLGIKDWTLRNWLRGNIKPKLECYYL